MSATVPPARVTACSAAATNDRPGGYRRSSEVWLKNTRSGPSTVLTLPRPDAIARRLQALPRAWMPGAAACRVRKRNAPAFVLRGGVRPCLVTVT